MRLLYFLLAISSILVIGCSGNDIIPEEIQTAADEVLATFKLLGEQE
jgi:hypothetical protein